MALPYPDLTFDPMQTLPAESLNELMANIAAVAAGTGLANKSVKNTAIDFTTGIWWEEIGRVTLSAAGDFLSVTGLPPRNFLMVVSSLLPSGGTINSRLSFNGDSGTNYAYRGSDSGGADTTNQSFNFIETAPMTAAGPMNHEMNILNVASSEKLVSCRTTHGNTAGAGNIPGRREVVGKWANTSAAISRIDLTNAGTGDYAIGSQLIVLGHN